MRKDEALQVQSRTFRRTAVSGKNWAKNTLEQESLSSHCDPSCVSMKNKVTPGGLSDTAIYYKHDAQPVSSLFVFVIGCRIVLFNFTMT